MQDLAQEIGQLTDPPAGPLFHENSNPEVGLSSKSDPSVRMSSRRSAVRPSAPLGALAHDERRESRQLHTDGQKGPIDGAIGVHDWQMCPVVTERSRHWHMQYSRCELRPRNVHLLAPTKAPEIISRSQIFALSPTPLPPRKDHRGREAMEAPALRLSQIDGDQRKFRGFLDVSYGSWSTESTVGDLERVLSAQTGLRVAYIAYRGMRLRKDSQLSSLILDLEDGSSPRFSVHTTSGENVFFVKSLAGNSVMVDIPLDSSTVKDLKAEVHALEKIPTEVQRFLYSGKHFADVEPITKTLRDYGVERDSTVQLLTRLRGGGADVPSARFEFSDLQNKSALKVLPWSKIAPVWRIVGKGLNLEGNCTNKACAAGKQRSRVVCKRGYTAVNLVTERAQCPICKGTVQVKTCSFTDCLWMYEGRKVQTAQSLQGLPQRVTSLLKNCFTGNPSSNDDDYAALEKQSSIARRDIVSPWFKASTKYEYFKQTKNMVQWENLLVVAKKVPTVAKDGLDTVIPHDEACSICFQKFQATKDRAKTHTTSCGHIFHADCVESWLSSSGTACPICRVDLVVEK